MPILVKMPKWGLMMKTGTVTEWLRAEGDPVSAGEPLFVVETDKAVNDVEAPGDGVLRRIVADEGTEVPVSGPVGVIAVAGESLTDEAVDAFVAAHAVAPPPPVAVAAPTAPRTERAPRPEDRAGGRIVASPAARKLAAELDIDLGDVAATGPGGRVTIEDVERAAGGGADDGEPREERVGVGDGIELYVLSAGPRDAPALVFVHGIGGSSSSWQSVIGAFAETHRVVALDLPGHGQSDVPDAATADYSVAGLAAAVSAALAALGLTRVTLVGHSLGGAVAMAVALAEPDAVERLVLVDSAGFGEEISGDLLALLADVPSEAGSRALLGLFFEDPRLVLDAGVAEHHGALSRPGAHDAVQAIAADAFPGGRQAAARPGDLTQPVLVIWGGRDRVVPAAHADAARTAIADVRVAVLPDSGHAPQVEDPEAFAAHVAGFLAD